MPPSAKLGWGTQESLPRTQPQGWGRQAGANIKENANLWAGSLDPEWDPGTQTRMAVSPRAPSGSSPGS